MFSTSSKPASPAECSREAGSGADQDSQLTGHNDATQRRLAGLAVPPGERAASWGAAWPAAAALARQALCHARAMPRCLCCSCCCCRWRRWQRWQAMSRPAVPHAAAHPVLTRLLSRHAAGPGALSGALLPDTTLSTRPSTFAAQSLTVVSTSAGRMRGTRGVMCFLMRSATCAHGTGTGARGWEGCLGQGSGR